GQDAIAASVTRFFINLNDLSHYFHGCFPFKSIPFVCNESRFRGTCCNIMAFVALASAPALLDRIARNR
ncbi:MAG: hypothetical protein R6V54_03390, partial [Desulfobacteraceae bacterium]